MNLNFRKATSLDIPEIWIIIQQAILRRKNDGSKQWQDGYPNQTVIQEDIKKNIGYVLTDGELIIGYLALILNDEPAYNDLKGKWLSDDTFIVIHRMAISDQYLGQGFAKKMFYYTEEFAKQHHIYSIKVDTNFDNIAMLKIFESLGYIYCGEVTFRGGVRKAFEKILI